MPIYRRTNQISLATARWFGAGLSTATPTFPGSCSLLIICIITSLITVVLSTYVTFLFLCHSELRDVFTSFRRQCEHLKKAEVSDNLISACIFLRFICPAIMNPSLFGLCQVRGCSTSLRLYKFSTIDSLRSCKQPIYMIYSQLVLEILVVVYFSDVFFENSYEFVRNF